MLEPDAGVYGFRLLRARSLPDDEHQLHRVGAVQRLRNDVRLAVVYIIVSVSRRERHVGRRQRDERGEPVSVHLAGRHGAFLLHYRSPTGIGNWFIVK